MPHPAADGGKTCRDAKPREVIHGRKRRAARLGGPPGGLVYLAGIGAKVMHLPL
jgi:hypothetical protein